MVQGAAGPARSGAGVGTAPPLLGTRHPPFPQQPLGRGHTPPPLVLGSACCVGLDGIVSSLMHAFPSDWDSVWWLLFITEVSAGCSERCLWPAACIPQSLLCPVIRPFLRRLCGQSSELHGLYSLKSLDSLRPVVPNEVSTL